MNENIIKKIQGLLAISRDDKNDEESQSAFLLAQKLMIKYNISKDDVETADDLAGFEIDGDFVTIHKRLFWWEKMLAGIIARNFRVKFYYNNKIIGKQKKRAIIFYGYTQDLELAKEMYLLAYEVVVFHSKNYVETLYNNSHLKRTRQRTEEIKSNYIDGFLAGLDQRFSEQVAELTNEYGLMVIVPKEVEKAYEEFSKDFGTIKEKKRKVVVDDSFYSGFKDGKKVDFTRSTVGVTDYSSIIGKTIKFNQGVTRNLYGKIIAVQDDTMYLLIMNISSDGSSIDYPAFYEWELDVEYPYEFIDDSSSLGDRNNMKCFEAYMKNDKEFLGLIFDGITSNYTTRIYNQICEELKVIKLKTSRGHV